MSPNFPKNHTLASTKMPHIYCPASTPYAKCPVPKLRRSTMSVRQNFSRTEYHPGVFSQPKCRWKNSVISSFSSIPKNPPLILLPLAQLWASGYPVFSKHLSYCTPIWRLNNDNNPHPDPIVTAHQRRRAHPLTLARHTRPERFSA